MLLSNLDQNEYTKIDYKCANGISYAFCYRKNGHIDIFQYEKYLLNYRYEISSRSIKNAENYIVFKEPVGIRLDRIC